MTKETEARILEISKKYPQQASVMMPALDLVQRANNNYLPQEEIRRVASLLHTTESKAYGVATYYTMFHTQPVGKYQLQVDTNIPGFLAGAYEILKHLKTTLKIDVGETTEDGLFTLASVEDLGSCGTCPVIQVNDTFYENMTIAKVDDLIASLKRGVMPEPEPSSYFYSDCQILLKNRGNGTTTHLEAYKKSGGYAALTKALTMQPAEVVAEVKASLLRGRGGAGFPTGVKWSFLPKDDSRPVYLICNADEGEPGTFKDRQIMEYDPHLLIEGLAISAYAIGSEKSFIYIRGEFRWIADILEAAIEEAKAAGYLDHLDIVVHRGAGSYVCGEETALIESLEGKRGNPRLKPPFPANVGLYGDPTIINNVETLACIPYIIEQGAEAFKQIGVTGNYGPKLYGVSGHVKKPGVFEFPLGTQLTTILEAAGGVDGTLKAVIVGGLSVPILKADEIDDVNMDYDGCLKAKTLFGSGGIMVINDTVSIPKLALRTIRFYAHESCGQCSPCRNGSYTLEHLLTKIVRGKGSADDLERALTICNTIEGITLCPTGDAFAFPIRSMILKFRDEFDALIQ